MALFPTLPADMRDDRDGLIRNKIETFYSNSISPNQMGWNEADTNSRFEAQDQDIISQYYGPTFVNNQHNKHFYFNHIRPYINMVSGHQRQNRKTNRISPRENGTQETADQATRVLYWLNDKESILETLSDAFQGALITGMNLLHIYMDYRSDPLSGDIKVDRKPMTSFLIDPYFTKMDLSDCTGILQRSFLTKRECMTLLPNHADEIMYLAANDKGDGKFPFLPQNYNFNTNNLLTYDEFYYRDYRTQTKIYDTRTNKSIEWLGDEAQLRQFLQLFPYVTALKHEVPTVNTAILVQGKVFYNDRNILAIDRYPFVPVIAYHRPELAYNGLRIQGLVTALRDPQYLYNLRMAVIHDTIMSQPNSGFYIKENTLVNPEDAYLSGQGKNLYIKRGASMDDIRKIEPAQLGPGQFELLQALSQEFSKTVGVSDENMGLAIDDKAGILAMLRMSAGRTGLTPLFDNLDHSFKILTSLLFEVIQTHFMPDKIERIIGEDATPEFHTKVFGEYDAVIEEGSLTSTQRQQAFAQAMYMKEAGIDIPNEFLLKMMTIQNKDELLDIYQKQQELVQQAQMMQQQVQMEQIQAQTELTKARATADTGLGYERMSRIEENHALAQERKAAAGKDVELGLLNLVRALREIDGVELDNLNKLVNLAHVSNAIKPETNPNPMVGQELY